MHRVASLAKRWLLGTHQGSADDAHLLRQGREIAHVVTADGQGARPNAPNTWGAIYRNGLIYAPDINTGLWVVKVESKSELVP